VDRWLVRTVGGLLAANGAVQLWVAAGEREALPAARLIGIGTAGWLALIDLRYGVPGRIRRVYVADALVEIGWVAMWSAAKT
jgi:hypothetical protein